MYVMFFIRNVLLDVLSSHQLHEHIVQQLCPILVSFYLSHLIKCPHAFVICLSCTEFNNLFQTFC